MACVNEVSFRKYFDENMKGLGMWVPSSSFDAFGGITAMIGAVATVVEANPMITLTQAFIRVGAAAIATNLAAITAAAWCGAAIGSFAVATGRTLSCGTSIADAMWTARSEFKIYGTWLEAEYIANPKLLGK